VFQLAAGILALALLALADRPIVAGPIVDRRPPARGPAADFTAAGRAPMTIEVVPRSRSGVFPDATLVYLDGQIDPDAPDRLSRALNDVDGKIVVWLNSPGGNLFAGMQLGRILRQRGAWTHIINYRTLRPGECYSACGLAFLGGVRRFSENGARYGVHRASLANGTAGDLDLAQDLSAAIASYVREMGVDARLLDLWKKAGPGQMYVLAPQEAEDLGVVNDGGSRRE
jgi:hypothetical protein